MKLRTWLGAAAVATGAAASTFTIAADPPPPKPVYSFGTLRAFAPEAAKMRAAAWLAAAGKLDQPAFDAVWSVEGRTTFDKTVDSLCLGSPEAAAMLAAAKDPLAPAPVELPAFLKDPKADAFFRANVATAYAKALSGKRVYEEALDVLKLARPEEVVDPATYYFYKAVTEHALTLREPAVQSIVRLLDDVADAPDRYKMVATLMFFDIQAWSKDQKDLSNIERLMDNSGRRLDLARGGKQTQEIQKKIVFRLDEVIKEMENKKKGAGKPGSSPGDGGTQPNGPAPDSTIMTGGGAGKVDDKKLKKLAEEWGKLPPSERAKAVQEITRDLPAKYKPMIEEYFNSLNKINGVGM